MPQRPSVEIRQTPPGASPQACNGPRTSLLNENGLAPTGFTVLDGSKALGKIHLEQRQGDRQDVVVFENSLLKLKAEFR